MPEKNYGKCAGKGNKRCLACWRNKMNHGNKLNKDAQQKHEIHGPRFESAPGSTYPMRARWDMYMRYQELGSGKYEFLSERYKKYRKQGESIEDARILANEDYQYHIRPRLQTPKN